MSPHGPSSFSIASHNLVLVTFADINDPKSVIEVDPNDLQATLGTNVTWNDMTLKMTDEPVTTGIIKAKLQ